MRTREEHLEFCKQRAMEYVNAGDLLNAVTSMMSDLDKHPETSTRDKPALSMLGLLAGIQAQNGDTGGVVRYIEGWS